MTTRPLYKRVFFSIYSYAIIYALFGVLSLSYHACFNSSLSTLEKRYHFSSTTGGYIMITDNIATVLTNLFIGYYGKTAHKPRWMSVGCVVTGLSVMITALPYFIYGSAQETELELVANKTLSRARAGDQMCLTKEHLEDCTQTDATATMTMVAVACFAISNFFRGFGTSIYFTYGTPYLDDNVSKAKMPTFFAFIFAARIFGAPIGFYLSSLALKVYESPFSVPKNLTNTDPRWIGAWWIGFLVSGSLMLLLGIPLASFPREFKKKSSKTKDMNGNITENEMIELADQQANDEDKKGSDEKVDKPDLSLSRLPGELYEIFTNPMIVCQMMGNLFRGIGFIGYYVFQTKYLESQFRQSASKASLVSGTTGFLGKIVGVLIGGLLITMCRPGPRTLTTYIFIVELTSVFALLYGASVMGPQYAYPRTSLDEAHQLDLSNTCNTACHCEHVRYQPVCEHKEMKAYFSPCHAGCTMSYATADNSSSEYTDCGCADSPTLQKCPPDTDSLLKYATIIAIGSMVSGSSRSGNMVTFFRSINPDQKSLAVAVGSFWHSLFVSIPYPIIYGKIFDYSCLVWSRECGTRGNCWLYDTEKLRYIYHGVSISLIALGSVFDLIMIFLSPRLGNLYDDDGKKSVRDRIVGMVTKRKQGDQTVRSEPSDQAVGSKQSDSNSRIGAIPTS
uniref:Solute carrier organic anion transporter family member n=2 Tax=Aceria tosichella TaxID=561515 RepID=A0A6G1S8G0_9ACAR